MWTSKIKLKKCLKLENEINKIIQNVKLLKKMIIHHKRQDAHCTKRWMKIPYATKTSISLPMNKLW
jgi:hypothetical protein